MLSMEGHPRISLSRKVALRVVPDRIEHERLAEEHLDFVVRPILCRQRLQEHDNALGSRGLERGGADVRNGYEGPMRTPAYLEVHLTELLAPPDEKR
jgi:hypothetical protein